ncbi:MAG: hypothetical protein RIS73_4 [Bacteroidota bacterium]
MEGKEIKGEPDLQESNVPAVTAARDHFIIAPYGKFDLIQAMIPIEILLYCKPRIIKKIISEKFGLLTSQINNDTFWSWLRRIRKSQEENVSFNKLKPQYIELFQSSEQAADWKNFTPSVPVMEKEAAQTIIKLVTATE